jgi:hypothetical protein
MKVVCAFTGMRDTEDLRNDGCWHDVSNWFSAYFAALHLPLAFDGALVEWSVGAWQFGN